MHICIYIYDYLCVYIYIYTYIWMIEHHVDQCRSLTSNQPKKKHTNSKRTQVQSPHPSLPTRWWSYQWPFREPIKLEVPTVSYKRPMQGGYTSKVWQNYTKLRFLWDSTSGLGTWNGHWSYGRKTRCRSMGWYVLQISACLIAMLQGPMSCQRM